MMFARLSVLALCAVAAIAIGAAAANPAGLPAEICVGRLAEALKGVTVPDDINALIAAVELDVPYNNGEDWDELDDEKVRAKHAAHYPAESCEKYLEEMEKIFATVIDDEACSAWQLSYSAHAMKLANADPVVGPIIKANSACDAFEPIEKYHRHDI